MRANLNSTPADLASARADLDSMRTELNTTRTDLDGPRAELKIIGATTPERSELPTKRRRLNNDGCAMLYTPLTQQQLQQQQQREQREQRKRQVAQTPTAQPPVLPLPMA